jgi:selenoprotein W-related protein
VVELLAKYEDKIESVKLIPSGGGRFEVSVNGKLVYSKVETGRHAEPGEVEALVAKRLSKDERPAPSA